jgi:hypothetical protein
VKAGLLLVATACVGGGGRSQCVFDDDCAEGFACFEGACTAGAHFDGGLGWCPRLAPRLSDIDQRLFRVTCLSAGAGTSAFGCHNSDTVDADLPTNGLDLQRDPWSALVDVPADNISARQPLDGGLPLLRVRRGDPESSFLAIKLRTAVNNDPWYGSGMPPQHPGALCADAQAAVAQWIREGAPRN